MCRNLKVHHKLTFLSLFRDIVRGHPCPCFMKCISLKPKSVFLDVVFTAFIGNYVWKSGVLDACGILALFRPSHIQMALVFHPSCVPEQFGVNQKWHSCTKSQNRWVLGGQFYQWQPLWYIYMHLHNWFSDNIEINKHLALLFLAHINWMGLVKKTCIHLSRRVRSHVTVVGD